MLHPNVAVAVNEGVIDGVGLIARDLIRAGEVVSRQEPDAPMMSIAEFLSKTPQEQAELSRYAYQCSETMLVFEGEPEHFMNHSCDPNTWWADDKTMVARRDIHAGEEITYDYAMTEVDVPFEMECRCGSPLCRKLITNRDYLDVGWQERYGNHLPPHTLKAIARAKALQSAK